MNSTGFECPHDYDDYNTSFEASFDLGINISTKVGCGDSNGTIPKRRLVADYASMMTLPLQLVWALVFTIMLSVAIGGNAIVIWSILAHRRMRTVTNYFLVNLSLADLLMSIFNCIFNFVYMINNDWYFGRYYCTINNFVANVTVAASVFTLLSITIDRYLAIVTPLKPRMTKCCAQITIAGIWSASLLLGFPCLLYSTTITYKQNQQTACILIWPDGKPMVSKLDYVYNIVLFSVTYFIPMAAMVCCYTSMARELWGSRSIGEMTHCQQECIKSKRKVVRMFFIIVFVFGICWLPYHSYFIYTYHKKDFVYSKYVQHLYLGFYWLAMANAMLNPLIYYCMNARFREYFHKVICEWSCCKPTVSTLTRSEAKHFPRLSSHSYTRTGMVEDTFKTSEVFKGSYRNVKSNHVRTKLEDWKIHKHVIISCKVNHHQSDQVDSIYKHKWHSKNSINSNCNTCSSQV